MPRIKLVALDLDGVIRDVSRVVYECHRAAMKVVGLDGEFLGSFSVDELWHFKGLGRFNNRKLSMIAVALILKAAKSGEVKEAILHADAEERIGRIIDSQPQGWMADKLDAMADAYVEVFNSDDSARMISIYPGAFDAVSKLARARPMAMVTNSSLVALKRDIPDNILSKFGAIITRRDVKASKPSPEGLMMISSSMKIDAKDMIYVGDTAVDVRAAKAAGCISAVVLSGMGLRQHLEKENPDFIFNDLNEAAAWILAN